MCELLLNNGADPTIKNNEGLRAQDLAKEASIKDILTPVNPGESNNHFSWQKTIWS